MARTKIVPCPSGPLSPDSFRAFEALEAGCIPLLDMRTPLDAEREFWNRLFGQGHPVPQIDSWPELLAALHRNLEEWPASSNRVFSFWQQHKRKMAHDLQGDAMQVGRFARAETPDDLITVVVPTSPIPSHPSTAVIDETIGSVRAQLPRAEILVMADGVRAEQEDRRPVYDEYLARLCWTCNRQWANVVPFLAERFSHQGELMRRALGEIITPLVLFVEHDTPLTGEIDWPAICAAVRSGGLNVVRLHHEVTILRPHEHLMLDRTPIDVTGVPIIRTAQWSQRPHVASAAFYRQLIDRWFDPAGRTMIEDSVYGPMTSAWLDRGEAGWSEWKVGIYAPEGNMQRSLHLDGRGDDPKYEMQIVRP
jgi:hypothetical protein